MGSGTVSQYNEMGMIKIKKQTKENASNQVFAQSQ